MTTSVMDRLTILTRELAELRQESHLELDEHPHYEQWDDLLSKVDRLLHTLNEAETQSTLSANDYIELGEYTISLFDSLIAWAVEHDLPGFRQQLAPLYLDTMDILLEHGIRIQQLDGLVNALADIANLLEEPQLLIKLTLFMHNLISACDEKLGNDQEKRNPGSPWRILHINYAIVATRTYRTDLQEQAYDILCLHLPEETEAFFAEAMKQMQIIDYPEDVKTVVARYHRQFTEHKMH